jgi:hypothetical protein
MASSWESVKVDESNMPLYASLPERGGPVPGIVVVHGQSGLESFIRIRLVLATPDTPQLLQAFTTTVGL